MWDETDLLVCGFVVVLLQLESLFLMVGGLSCVFLVIGQLLRVLLCMTVVLALLMFLLLGRVQCSVWRVLVSCRCVS